MTRAPLTIAHLTPELIATELTARGWKLGRATNLLRAAYQQAAGGKPIDAGDFGAPALWAASLPASPTKVLRTHTATDGTQKLLVACHDTETTHRHADPAPAASTMLSRDPQGSEGSHLTLTQSSTKDEASDTVECVLMPTDRPGIVSACVSSQVGCAMACDFCASGLAGLSRNLTAAEITGQFLHLLALARAQGNTLGTLVFMGMGEPLHNLTHVLAAIHRIAGPDCLGFGYKNIQVSTVGIVPAIHKLTASGARVQLALSLHGPDDATRSSIVPAGKKYTVADTLAAAYAHQEASGRISNIEYCLLADINDTPAHARQLAAALGGRRMHVNLIPHNPIGAGPSGTIYRRPTKEAQTAFLTELRAHKVVAHLRKTRGDDQSAACGQLRRVALTVA